MNWFVVAHAVNIPHLGWVSLLYRYLSEAVTAIPVNRRRRQCDIEGNVVVVSRKRLEIRANLVGNVPATRRAIGARDDNIDLTVLHKVTASVVDDQCVRNIVGGELPGG